MLTSQKAVALIVALASSLTIAPLGSLTPVGRDGVWAVVQSPSAPSPVYRRVSGGILYSTALAYHPNGTLIAVASDNGTIRLFDTEGNAVGDPLGSLTGRMSTLAFSPDGTRLVGATDDGSIQFWDLEGNPLVNPFSGHDSAITAVVFSPDGDSIATAGADGTVRRWDLEGMPLGDPLTGHGGTVTSLAFSPDGRAIASGGVDGTVRLWTRAGDPLGDPLDGHDGAVNAVAFSPDGEAIASGGIDGTVRQWAMDGTPIGSPFAGHAAAVNAVAYRPNRNIPNRNIPIRRTLVSAGADGVVRLSDATGQATGTVMETEQGAIDALAVSANGDALISGGTDGTFRIWATSGTPISAPIEGFTPAVTPTRQSLPRWLGWLLPLAAVALLLWWLSRRGAVGENGSGRSSGNQGDSEVGDRLSPQLASAFNLAAAGKKTDALNTLDTALRDEPTNTLAWIARGNVQIDLDKPDDALHSFDKALAIQADDPQALVGKGIALTKLGNPEASLPLFDRAITAMNQLPSFPIGSIAAGGLLLGGKALMARALVSKGFALLDAPQPQPALDAFNAALRHDPGSVDAIAGRNRALTLLSTSPPRVTPAPSPPLTCHTNDPTDVDGTDLTNTDLTGIDLTDIDDNLPDLPDGYGDSRITLLPRDPHRAYAYWDIPNDHKESLRQQGGETLALRLYDVTNQAMPPQDAPLQGVPPQDVPPQNASPSIQYVCDELARDWFIPVPMSDRDYLVEIGYVTGSGTWLMLARSGTIHIPPLYPSDWFQDQFMTVSWEDDLRGTTLTTLHPPDQLSDAVSRDAMGDRAWFSEFLPAAGSLSSIGFSASAPPMRPGQFWLVADAELIVYGSTEPGATVTLGDRPIPLNPDGTFRIQLAFQDGELAFPIRAIAPDGEQQRSMRLEFERDTPTRNTTPPDDATDD